MEWNLTKIYKSEAEYEADLELLIKLGQELTLLKGKLNEKANLIKYLEQEEELDEKIDRLYLYAMLGIDKDANDEFANKRYLKLNQVLNNIGKDLATFSTELISLGKGYLLDAINTTNLAKFKRRIDVLFNLEDHILSESEEKLFSYLTTPYSGPRETYDYLTVNDIKYETIELDGKVTEISHANYHSLQETTTDPVKRTEIFKSFYTFYYNHKQTFFMLYKQIIEQQVNIAKARGYKSILDYKLKPNQIDEAIYLNLVNTAKENTSAIKKYLEIRKKYYKLEKVRTYDRFLPLAKDETKYDYTTSKQIFLDALAKYTPSDFVKHGEFVLEEGRVDIYPRKGKASGAYSAHSYQNGPFIKLNHNDTLDSLFTLAHEAGHSMHSTYSIEHQPFVNHSYKIFVAEIASTFNEALLLDYLIETAETKEKRIALIDKEINNILGTFYRQTLFATYELEVFNKAWNDETITMNTLSETMIDLYKTYYGIDIKEEEYKEYVWAYIPHFYHTPFYVYQYATSFAASQAIWQRVKQDKSFFNNYLELLKAGDSAYPAEIVKNCGCDLTKKETFLAVVDRLNYLVNELEKELAL